MPGAFISRDNVLKIIIVVVCQVIQVVLIGRLSRLLSIVSTGRPETFPLVFETDPCSRWSLFRALDPLGFFELVEDVINDIEIVVSGCCRWPL